MSPALRRRARAPDVADASVAAADAFAAVQPSTLGLSGELGRVERLRRMVAPHVGSFNFAAGGALEALPETIGRATLRAAAGDAPRADAPRISVRYNRLALNRPRFGGQSMKIVESDVLPVECRRAGVTYAGELLGEYEVRVDGRVVDLPMRRIARVPIMVGSDKCNLAGKSPAEMVAAGEEQYELGGYFVINGAEKLLRMITVPRANCVVSMRRDANTNRGPLYTELSVAMRCMRRDLSTTTTHMHMLRTGAATVRVTVSRAEYFVPVGVLLRALLPSGVSARAIFDLIVGGQAENEALRATALAVVTDLHTWALRFKAAPEEQPGVHVSMSRYAALAYVGGMFRVVLRMDDDETDVEAGVKLIREYMLVHLSTGPYEAPDGGLDNAKVNLLVHMIRKLVACTSGDIELDNGDAPSFHELLLPGQLYLNFLKDRLEVQLLGVAAAIRREMLKAGVGKHGEEGAVVECVNKGLAKMGDLNRITQQMNYFLATGNIKTETGLDLPQAAGYAIMAERINYLRFITHFRCIHRGAFYTTLRTTKVRKLLPEAWGFVCPVQTPDGAPCGLLNHLASSVEVTIGTGTDIPEFEELMCELGAYPSPACSALVPVSLKDSVPLLCDGCVVGYVSTDRAESFANLLRQLKTEANVSAVPNSAEIIYVAKTAERGTGFYPGIYVHTTGCRMMRPVTWLMQKKDARHGSGGDEPGENGVMEEDSGGMRGTPELIGTMEQVFLHIRPAVSDAEGTVTPVYSVGATHQEISSPSFMSEVASLTPFPDMNQGPRNIFQCQMAKQTMGTPCHRFDTRYDAKVYRLTIPQVPITRNFCMQGPMGADLFPNGTNGIVAVISYTGYDMEDALILNQGSVNRGFAHGTIYANKRIDLEASAMDKASQFGPLTHEQSAKIGTVDTDGLPVVGARIRYQDKICVTTPLGNTAADNSKPSSVQDLRWTNHKSVETATVDHVEVVNGAAYTRDSGKSERGTIRQANIRTRFSRPPSVGDKFATRAGQKGTIASVWPTENMPFAESGMMPDVLFNPNGFPSRMTIGMMVEQMAGKSGALHGKFHDSTPFRFDEKCRAVDYFGDQLVKAGYNYYGNETLYSGYTGEPFKVDIFMGVIHYQRLRHMVSDKFQVRSTGKIHPIYRQPIQGRKRGGAIRFGEMERDGVLAHGASFILRDRLGMASDMHVLHVCEDCGSLIAPTATPPGQDTAGSGGAGGMGGASPAAQQKTVVTCRVCHAAARDSGAMPRSTLARQESRVQRVALPYSFKYLVHELAAMNIRTKLDLKSSADVALRGPLKA